MKHGYVYIYIYFWWLGCHDLDYTESKKLEDLVKVPTESDDPCENVHSLQMYADNISAALFSWEERPRITVAVVWR
jgi:hypothetical protein